MKRLALVLALSACGTDSKETAATLVAPETTTTATATSEETTQNKEATTEPEADPDGRPKSGPIAGTGQFKKFSLAESDCSIEHCIVRFKIEGSPLCFARLSLMAYQLKDGYLWRATSVVTIPSDWTDGKIVTMTLPAVPSQDESDYAAEGFEDQSGVLYNCSN